MVAACGQPAAEKATDQAASTATDRVIAAPATAPATPAALTAAAREWSRRYVAADWIGADTLTDPAQLVAGLQEFVAHGPAVFGRKSRQTRRLANFLARTKPEPSALRDLLGPHGQTAMNEHVLRHDNVRYAVVISLLMRVYGSPNVDRPALVAALVEAGVHSAFDPVFGSSPTATGTEIVDFLLDPEVRPDDASRTALSRSLPALTKAWRQRKSQLATASFLAILARHLGAPTLDLFAVEWEHMEETERLSYLGVIQDLERPLRAARLCLVNALADPSGDVRLRAEEALEKHEAPVGDLSSGRDADLRRALPELRRWAEKTDP